MQHIAFAAQQWKLLSSESVDYLADGIECWLQGQDVSLLHLAPQSGGHKKSNQERAIQSSTAELLADLRSL